MRFTLYIAYKTDQEMEARFKSLSLFEFQQRFPDEGSCLAYLDKLKWENGLVALHDLV